jgi:hypothetical protein
MILDREDVERITQLMLQQLKIEISPGSAIQPNKRTICLKMGNMLITEADIDITPINTI